MSPKNSSPQRGQPYEFVGACRAWQWIMDPVASVAKPTMTSVARDPREDALSPCRYFRHPNRESCLWIGTSWAAPIILWALRWTTTTEAAFMSVCA